MIICEDEQLALIGVAVENGWLKLTCPCGNWDSSTWPASWSTLGTVTESARQHIRRNHDRAGARATRLPAPG